MQGLINEPLRSPSWSRRWYGTCIQHTALVSAAVRPAMKVSLLWDDQHTGLASTPCRPHWRRHSPAQTVKKGVVIATGRGGIRLSQQFSATPPMCEFRIFLIEISKFVFRSAPTARLISFAFFHTQLWKNVVLKGLRVWFVYLSGIIIKTLDITLFFEAIAWSHLPQQF